MHEQLYEQALNAIREVFGDKSVSASTTRASLTALEEEISILMDSLEASDDGH